MSAGEENKNEKQLTSSLSKSPLSSSSVLWSCCLLNLSTFPKLMGQKILTLRWHSCFAIFKPTRILIFFGNTTAMSWYISNQSFAELTSTAFDALRIVSNNHEKEMPYIRFGLWMKVLEWIWSSFSYFAFLLRVLGQDCLKKFYIVVGWKYEDELLGFLCLRLLYLAFGTLWGQIDTGILMFRWYGHGVVIEESFWGPYFMLSDRCHIQNIFRCIPQ